MTGDVFFQAERAETSDLRGGRDWIPELSEFAFLVGLFEEMVREDGEAVKDTLLDAVSFGESENDRLLVEFSDGDGLAADDEEIALGRMETFVEVETESEEDVVSIDRIAVRETEAAAKSERVLKAIGGNFPRFRQGGLGELGSTVDVNEIGLHGGDNVAGRRVGREKRVQRLGFGAE